MKRRNFKKWASTAIAAASLLTLSQNASAVAVDLELSLVIDVSGSIDANEFNLQRAGYANAFTSGAVSNFVQTLGDAGTGGVAVNVIFFATNAVQRVGWTQLASAADSIAFGNTIAGLSRTPPGPGGTDIAEGMQLSIDSFTNGFEGTRLTMDVSGDGQQNTGCVGNCITWLQSKRDAAAAAGITVNGLAIQGLAPYYDANVRTADGFVIAAADFNDFGRAVQEKVLREITGAPEPGMVMLLGIGLAGLGFSRRYRRKG